MYNIVSFIICIEQLKNYVRFILKGLSKTSLIIITFFLSLLLFSIILYYSRLTENKGCHRPHFFLVRIKCWVKRMWTAGLFIIYFCTVILFHFSFWQTGKERCFLKKKQKYTAHPFRNILCLLITFHCEGVSKMH